MSRLLTELAGGYGVGARTANVRGVRGQLAVIVLCCWTSWAGAQRNLKEIPSPDPAVELASFVVADGLEVNLYASDPQLAKPIQMNFDAQGRLWIASSEVYPQIKPGQQPTDKIVVVEDLDGDGVAEKTRVFAEGLLIPTGVVPGDGGVYVANSTELAHFSDRDGDFRADEKRVVLSGFGTEDTHHLLHTLRWGPDGCLYMNQSIYIHSHVETPWGVKHLNGGGIWRFRPETMELDVFCRGFVNPWGHHFDAWGQSFATDGAYGEGINYVFPGAVFVTAPEARRVLHGLNPGSPKHCGLEILSGRHLPAAMRGNMITNDFRANRVCRFVVSENRSGFASRQEAELIKTRHVAFRPIDVKMGPDGAIYIADWYNPIIQHGEVDFRDDRRDHTHGRIWRITAKGRPLLKMPRLSGAGIAELLAQLRAPEAWVRLWAKRMLKRKPAEEVMRALSDWVAALNPRDTEFERLRVEALWAYESINRVDEQLIGEILRGSPDHRARAAAMRVVSWRQDELTQAADYLLSGVLDDHPRVRLEAVRGLAQRRDPLAAQTALRVLDRPMDRFLDFALWQAMQDLQPYWLAAMRSGELDLTDQVNHLAYALQAVNAQGMAAPLLALFDSRRVAPQREEQVLKLVAQIGQPDQLGKLLGLILDQREWSVSRRSRLLVNLVEATTERQLLPAGNLQRVEELFESDQPALLLAAIRAAGTWRVDHAQPKLVARLAELTDVSRVGRELLAALRRLGAQDALAQAADTHPVLAIRRLAVQELAELDPAVAARRAVGFLREWPVDRPPDALIAAFLEHKQGPPALVRALADVEIPPDVARMSVRAVLGTLRQAPELLKALRQAGRLNTAGWKLTPALLRELLAEVPTEGDPVRGERIFRQSAVQCLKCHAIGGAGGRVGPDLVSIGASAPLDYLVEALLDPNRKIKENFHSLLVETEEGRIYTGIPVRESKTELVLRDVEDRRVTIPRDSIENQTPGRSLMPDGLVDTLTRRELRDLLRFLSELGRVGDFTVDRRRWLRRWQSLQPTSEILHRLRRTSYDTVANADPAIQWAPVYSTVAGALPIDELPQFKLRNDAGAVTFLRGELDVSSGGQVGLRLNDKLGLTLWVDGNPHDLANSLQFDWQPGRHWVTVGVDLSLRATPLRLELVDIQGSAAQVQFVTGK
ncbi:MAG: sorbosone dehydrogenase [Planctomycetaceae bacterium]|nr:sorbosone dehydrogenase [Planctomycetaceae bacterium]